MVYVPSDGGSKRSTTSVGPEKGIHAPVNGYSVLNKYDVASGEDIVTGTTCVVTHEGALMEPVSSPPLYTNTLPADGEGLGVGDGLGEGDGDGDGAGGGGGGGVGEGVVVALTVTLAEAVLFEKLLSDPSS